MNKQLNEWIKIKNNEGLDEEAKNIILDDWQSDHNTQQAEIERQRTLNRKICCESAENWQNSKDRHDKDVFEMFKMSDMINEQSKIILKLKADKNELIKALNDALKYRWFFEDSMDQNTLLPEKYKTLITRIQEGKDGQ